MVAFKNHVRHSESDLLDAIEWCRKHRQNPAHWEARLKELKNEQLRKSNRAARRAEKAAGARA